MPTEMKTLYKLCSEIEWRAAVAAGVYTGSADDARDGFIHFSFAHQLVATAAKYFAGRTDLMLIAVERDLLGAALRLEPSRGGDLFPHLYAALRTDCASWAVAIAWDGEAHVWPLELREAVLARS